MGSARVLSLFSHPARSPQEKGKMPGTSRWDCQHLPLHLLSACPGPICPTLTTSDKGACLRPSPPKRPYEIHACLPWLSQELSSTSCGLLWGAPVLIACRGS